MKRYLYENPRGFANEFFVYSVTPNLVREAEKIIESYSGDPNGEARWITAKEAERFTAQERKKARERTRMGFNLSQNPVGATEIEPLSEHLHPRKNQKEPF